MSNNKEDIIWTEEKCIQLIREYKSRTSLWDSSDPWFYKQSVRPEEWESIGRSLNLSGTNCKYKMTILMSSFRREKAKFVNSLKAGKIFTSTWFAFKELSFLMNRKIDSKKNLHDDIDKALLDHQYQLQPDNSAIVDMPEEMNYGQDVEYANDIKLEPESNSELDTNSCEETLVPTPGPSQKKREVQEKRETVKTYNVETSTDPIDLEEITAFTNFIQSKMKKYSEKTVRAVEKAVLNILFKADLNHYENDKYEALEENISIKTKRKKLTLKRKRNSKKILIEKQDLRLGESSD